MFLLTLSFCLILSNNHCKATFTNRIVGGRPINISEVPFQLSIHNPKQFICGGSLITPDVGLTASHCVCRNRRVIRAKDFTIYAGSETQKSSNAIKVVEITSHNKYNPKTLENDIALLKLDKKLNITTAILPQPDFEVPVGSNVTVSGWGSTNETGPTSSKLQAVILEIIDHEVCKQTYASFNKVTDKMLCAGVTEGGKDSCYGDSGGPLTYQNILVGIVSWGLGCARPNISGVYTKTSKYIQFINNTIVLWN